MVHEVYNHPGIDNTQDLKVFFFDDDVKKADMKNLAAAWKLEHSFGLTYTRLKRLLRATIMIKMIALDDPHRAERTTQFFRDTFEEIGDNNLGG